VTGRALFERVRARGHRQVEFVPERDAVAARVAALMRPGDMVLTVGAGDIYKVGHALAERLAG
jgi:UDP-N-acetylmuramate--alanine ligase